MRGETGVKIQTSRPGRYLGALGMALIGVWCFNALITRLLERTLDVILGTLLMNLLKIFG